MGKTLGSKYWQKGSILILVIVAIIAISALSIGMSQISSVSTLNQLEFNQANNARNLAYSGVEYSKGLALSYSNQSKTIDQLITDLNSGGASNTNSYSLGGDIGSFILTAKKIDDSSLTIDSVGTTPAGPFQAKYNIPSVVSISFSDNNYTGNVLSVSGEKITTSDDGTSHVEDASPNENTGTIFGRLSHGHGHGSSSGTSTPVTVTTGKFGNGLAFDCTRYAGILFEDITAYDIYYSGTIMLWFYAYNFNHNVAGLVHKGESTTSCTSSDGQAAIFTDEVYTLQFWPVTGSTAGNVYLLFSIIDGRDYTGRCDRSWNYIPIYSTTTFNNQNDAYVWHFVAVTWIYDSTTNATKLIMYIDGAKDNETEWTKPFRPRSNNSGLILGAQQNSTNGNINTYFCGVLDEINVFNTPLSESKITTYYNKYK